MRQERQVGYEIKALSNLLRRKILEVGGAAGDDDFTEMQAKLLGFLCRNRDQEIYQKTIEEVFTIRRSTASRLLKGLEEAGYVQRLSVSRDARLKQVVVTEKAMALNQRMEGQIRTVEAALTRGLSQTEMEQFLQTVEKLKRNLM